MKIRPSLFTGLTLLLLAGCGQNASSDSGAAAAGTPASPRIVEITANDTMKYDTTAIAARPGETLTVVLTNTGTVPKEIMGHDWVLLKAGSDVVAYATAASVAKDTNYIPATLNGEILAQIGLLGPRKSDQVTFAAPTVPGDYPFLCTFPAHCQAGMHGLLTVK